MSMNLMAKAMSIKVGNPLRKLVLIKLADNANDNGECWPSYQHIADQCEISKRSVMNHIAALCDSGLVKKVTRKGEKGNSSNIYLLHLDGAGDSLVGSANNSLSSAANSPGSAGVAPGGSAGDSPRTSHSFEPVKEPLESKKKSTVMPEGFSPSEAHQKMANEYGISLQEEFEKFTDHHLSKGSKFIDWNRALNTWLRNARGFQKSRTSTSFSKPSSPITVSKTGYVFFDR
ncbi:helix-turn-helix domain-containing protein [Cronobacter sakazakii]|nr:helix-turn-helix domain-containing protein [Cronobacter sakazakii]NCH77955.1 helix-turn-helix domain-containing protein [Cronobacter sakazakii]